MCMCVRKSVCDWVNADGCEYIVSMHVSIHRYVSVGRV